jgi:hypothetical protein
MDSAEQTLLNFDSDNCQQGHTAWQQQRQQALLKLSCNLGLPLGRKVEVWLRNEIRLVGTLRLQEEQLFIPDDRTPDLQFVVDNVPFRVGEMNSCVALD